MTNFEKIKALLESGAYKGVEVIYGGEKETIEKVSSLQYYRMDRITSITPIPNQPKLRPVGTKVRVFEEYDDIFKEELFTIKLATYLGYLLEPKITVPHRAVYPV